VFANAEVSQKSWMVHVHLLFVQPLIRIFWMEQKKAEKVNSSSSERSSFLAKIISVYFHA